MDNLRNSDSLKISASTISRDVSSKMFTEVFLLPSHQDYCWQHLPT